MAHHVPRWIKTPPPPGPRPLRPRAWAWRTPRQARRPPLSCRGPKHTAVRSLPVARAPSWGPRARVRGKGGERGGRTCCARRPTKKKRGIATFPFFLRGTIYEEGGSDISSVPMAQRLGVATTVFPKSVSDCLAGQHMAAPPCITDKGKMNPVGPSAPADQSARQAPPPYRNINHETREREGSPCCSPGSSPPHPSPSLPRSRHACPVPLRTFEMTT